MPASPTSLAIHADNSRIRVVSAHVVANTRQVQRSLLGRVKAGTLVETRDREWRGCSYRFGADWLTPQALQLLGMGDEGVGRDAAVMQFELPEHEFPGRSIRSSVTFAARDRDAREAPSGSRVTVTKCGAVVTAMDVALVWVELALESEAPAVWLDLIRTVRHRVRPGDDDAYLRRFRDEAGSPLGISEILLPVELAFLGDREPAGIRSARNLFLFGRYKTLTHSASESRGFLQKAARKGCDTDAPPGAPEADAESCPVGDEASIADACGLDAVAIGLWQRPGEKQGVGAVAFRNVFHLGDLWLSFLVCVVQFQMLVSLERQMLELIGHLERIADVRGWVFRLRELLTVRSRYESVMSRFIQGYWRLGLVQIHSHERRHRVYQRLRETMSLDPSLAGFHEKLEILDKYVSEKQKDVLGWFLVYVPFVSFLVGVFGINVKGWTSEEGLTPSGLLVGLAVLTAGYAVCVTAALLLLRGSHRRPND